MTPLLKIIILAVIQGIAEFLPISSSGHLAIIQNLFDIHGSETLLVSIVLHAGTLVAILVFYAKEIIQLFTQQKWNSIILIIIGSVPAGIIGVLIKGSGLDDIIFTNTYITGIGLLITALLLKFGVKKSTGEKQIQELSIRDSFFIGLFQAFAILPGISRSGSTIAGGLIKKLKSTEAATFSFILAIPAIAGAVFVEMATHVIKSTQELPSQIIPDSGLVLGFFISAVTGYFSLKFLINILKKGKLNIFAYYCFFLGIIVILWQLLDAYGRSLSA